MFLNVLFKSIKSDPSMNRVKAFVKRMLHVCSCHSPSFTCGCLLLLSEVYTNMHLKVPSDGLV